jgi:hypothetical protein
MSICRVNSFRNIFKFNLRIIFLGSSNDGDLLEWYPSQVKGPVDDEVQEGIKIFERDLFNRIFLFS